MINVTFEGYFSVKLVLWRCEGNTSCWRVGATKVRGRCHTLASSVSCKTHLLFITRAGGEVGSPLELFGVRLYQTATEVKFFWLLVHGGQ